jgi:hypothetical protein
MLVIAAIERGEAVPVDAVARSIGVPSKSLLSAYGFARVKSGSVWYTTRDEADRVRGIVRPTLTASLFAGAI